MNPLPSHSSFRILLFSKAAAKNSMYSMVPFPSVPTPQTQACWQFRSNHSKCSTKFALCDMAIGVLKHSKICRKCCVSSSEACQARAVEAAFCNISMS